VLNNLSLENKKTILYIILAFTFSIAMRLIWVYQFNDYEAFHYAGQFMINTNDGYYWAEGARDILAGGHEANDLSPIDKAVSQLTAFFATILPFSFESIIFYMPAFLSSLVVIPMILIARALSNLELGLIAALLASIAWSYYNRTMVGYYDTDMLNIVLPMFLLWSIIWAVKTNESIYLIFTALDILVYRWWYPQSYSLEFAFFGLIAAYTLFFDRKNLFNYKLLAIMMLAMMNGDGYMRLGLVVVAFFIFREKRFDKFVFYILGAAIVGFFISGGFTPIWSKLVAYVIRDSVSSASDGLGLHFFNVMQTVREAGHIPFETFANRISGHTITFLVSLGGYLYLIYKHKVMMLSIPLVGLGFLAYFGGLRFTIYAVPILAFGIAFLITELARIMPTKKLKYLSMVTFTLVVIFPNYKHIEAYKVPTVFNVDEVKVLDMLKKIADREDYVISWWDYGYPLRYYTNMKTLIDGGKHSGQVNFPVSYILTHPQQEAAKIARLDVEYTENNFKEKRVGSNIEQMTKDYQLDNTNDFLSLLSTDIELPKKSRDIYLYLPFRLVNIYPTVSRFSNIDLMNGDKGAPPLFVVSNRFKDIGDQIQLAPNISLNKRTSVITLGTKKVPIRRFVMTKYDNHMKLQKNVKLLNFTSNVNVIYMADYNTFLIVDEKTYNSLFIQLFVLENYDKSLFEPVVLSPNAKVFRLKI